ncbi:MAG TPA: hypothetical protein VJW20_17665 [Candidatus Angelobacter sp.]|nr:hypothetical protein [Candidatus Angelobacter sp.]
MTKTLVRMLALATLATSLSAFAAAGESKHNDAANTSTSKQQNGCGTAKEDKNTRKDGKTQQEKDFDRLLMGIYG